MSSSGRLLELLRGLLRGLKPDEGLLIKDKQGKIAGRLCRHLCGSAKSPVEIGFCFSGALAVHVNMEVCDDKLKARFTRILGKEVTIIFTEGVSVVDQMNCSV